MDKVLGIASSSVVMTRLLTFIALNSAFMWDNSFLCRVEVFRFFAIKVGRRRLAKTCCPTVSAGTF